MSIKQICEICGKTYWKPYETRACSKKCRVILRDKASICFDCGRAYAKPYILGGCEKILYGRRIYDEYEDIETFGETIRKVTKCKFWIPAGRR
jgi:hypothetical protein